MAWDKTLIAEGVDAPDLNNEIRANWTALEAMLNAWNRFVTGGTQSGQPRQGAARPYFQDAVPTTRLDGEYFDEYDLGCIWIDSNATIDNQFNILTAADGAGTEVWTPISTEIIAVLLASAQVFESTLGVTGNFAVGANKVVVTAASGNTAIAGTLDVAGVATLGDGSVATTQSAADNSTKISTTAYVNTNVGDSYRLTNVNGTSVKVYTKYFTGTTDADSETVVAHGVTAAKILLVSVIIYDSGNSKYSVAEYRSSSNTDQTFTIRYDATNIVLTSLGSTVQGQAYRIRIDYTV